MPFEHRQTSVEVVQVVGAAPDLGALPGNELAQLGGHALTMARRTKRRQFARPVERKIERAEANQEAEPLDVR